MKIVLQQIPLEGVAFEESIPASELELETDVVSCDSPVLVKARVSRITNAVTIHLEIETALKMLCSRCLRWFVVPYGKKLQLNYQTQKDDTVLDLNPDIRQEIFLDYPLKPLCVEECRGLCPGCGVNLNDGPCACARRREEN